ncbi:FAD/NAD(P)-binding domain-containing protein [Pseudovirgaria hyperparasitica]|uniref:FAD/NAD(P)-binding domain-containing protein n=1 Tax=Pseudovirgaria hyperparasitica TaxID=470096 RepID=A0A6A6VST8_9PEZI|nr:FAD/NAD(P)-binding domain-containing protein [Pseudovirgaria hyperparasitica]KAF2753652.1 FAD/NAD(P)-binding domain-containing protein [Pseudovirgaria hyperparasitica]
MNTHPHVIIIGAGIGGLTTAIGPQHCVKSDVRSPFWSKLLGFPKLEQLFILTNVIRAPNATRVLQNLGVLAEVTIYANKPAGLVVRRYDDDSEIGPRSHSDGLDKKFDSPMLVIHRADLQRVLLKAVHAQGARLHMSARVKTVDPDFNAKVELETGQQFEGDLVVGADGINSQVRAQMVRYWEIPDELTATGDAAYRVTIPRHKLLECPGLIQEIDGRVSSRWIGPHGHIMAYPLRGNELYNVVMVHRNEEAGLDKSNIWTRRGRMTALLRFYGSWSPLVNILAKQINTEGLVQWPLETRPHLPSWSVNRICLLGDSVHAMLPYVAQGAAQAIEDAAVLGTCLSQISDIPQVLSIYERVRKARAEFIQNSASTMRTVLHYEDGVDQEKRDAIMRAPRIAGWKHPDLWADAEYQNTVWGYDVIAETQRECSKCLEPPNNAERQVKRRSRQVDVCLNISGGAPDMFMITDSTTKSTMDEVSMNLFQSPFDNSAFLSTAGGTLSDLSPPLPSLIQL